MLWLRVSHIRKKSKQFAHTRLRHISYRLNHSIWLFRFFVQRSIDSKSLQDETNEAQCTCMKYASFEIQLCIFVVCRIFCLIDVRAFRRFCCAIDRFRINRLAMWLIERSTKANAMLTMLPLTHALRDRYRARIHGVRPLRYTLLSRFPIVWWVAF